MFCVQPIAAYWLLKLYEFVPTFGRSWSWSQTTPPKAPVRPYPAFKGPWYQTPEGASDWPSALALRENVLDLRQSLLRISKDPGGWQFVCWFDDLFLLFIFVVRVFWCILVFSVLVVFWLVFFLLFWLLVLYLVPIWEPRKDEKRAYVL